MNVDGIAKTVQVLGVVVGVVISVLSFNATREKELMARYSEIEARRFEASKPFLDLRHKLYVEAVKAAAILSNPDGHTQEQLRAARLRFRELYVAELSMVESVEVERKMFELAKQIDPNLIPLNPAQKAAYDLAHSFRDSIVTTPR